MKGFFCLLLCALLCLSVVNCAAAEQTGTLSVSYPIDGTVYHLYSVGTLENGQIVLDRAFRRVDTSDYAKAASVMANMVKLTGAAKELASAKVQNGKAVFSDLPMAVYLVLGDSGTKDGVQYWPTPFLLSIPQKGENEGYQYQVTVQGKHEVNMDISVVKRWVGDMILYRPTSVTVRLMRDGKTYGNPVVLNYTNNWSHMWTDLPPDNWYVTEDPNPRYTTAITRQGNTFVVTNTWKSIPQTGQLWWPVSVLALAGLLFLCLGLARRRRTDDHA